MNTYEIVRKAVAALWPYPDLGHMTATEVNKRENYNEMAILVAITEATDQLQKELERRDKKLKELMEEWSKSDAVFQSQLSTARESALREAIDKIEWRIKVLSLGCEKTYETAIHELHQRIEDIQFLIATPASECEWTKKGKQ